MARAASLYVGVHDFRRFAGRPDRPGASTVREIWEALVEKTGDTITIEVEGNAFLPHQVRRMAGALVDVGRNALTSEDIAAMLEGGSDSATARSLPARGLCLMRVRYAERVLGDSE